MKFLFVLLMFICIELPVFAQTPGYVYINGKRFMLDGKPFYPVGVNYWVKILYDPDDGTITGFTPGSEYSADNCIPCNLSQNPNTDCFPHPNSCRDAIKEDLLLFHENGINAIMLGGFDIDTMGASPVLKFFAFPNDQSCPFPNPNQDPLNPNDDCNSWANYFPLDGNETLFTDYISDFLSIVDEVNAETGGDMKVILVASEPGVTINTDVRLLFRNYLFALGNKLNASTSLLAYSIVHEANTKNIAHTKDTVCSMVGYWHDALKKYDPYHLTSISTYGAGDAAIWDPAILSVDFLDFHIYDEQPGVSLADRIKNVSSGFYWVNQVTTLPWIVGETGYWFSNEGDKTAYAKQTLERVRDCGGAGYFWYPHKNKSGGLISGILDVYNNPTSTADEFLNFNPFTLTNTCEMPLPNYYNWYNYSGNFVSGTVLDQNNNPVENAVVWGWNASYGCPTQTFTKADGSFVLPADNLSDGCLGNLNNDIIRVSAFSSSVVNDDNFTFPPFNFESTYLLTSGSNLTEAVQNITIATGQSENYSARKSIEIGNVTVQSGGNMNAIAGKEIHVGQTTHFSYGSNVRLSIGNVPPDCSDPANSLTDWKRLGNTGDNSKPKEKDTVIILYPETNTATALKKTGNIIAEVEVIPNPAAEKFFVILPQGKGNIHFEVSLLNPVGKTIYKQEFYNKQVISFETSLYADGIYFVLIKTEDGYRSVKKIAIQK